MKGGPPGEGAMDFYRMTLLMGLCGAALAVAAAGGCSTDTPQVRPPQHPEEFRAPPETDLRYSKPIEYPKDTMDEDTILKKAKDAAKSSMGGPGANRSGGLGRPNPGGY